jgi:hypothetical protein
MNVWQFLNSPVPCDAFILEAFVAGIGAGMLLSIEIFARGKHGK